MSSAFDLFVLFVSFVVKQSSSSVTHCLSLFPNPDSYAREDQNKGVPARNRLVVVNKQDR